MSKNLRMKALAFGSMFSLAVSGIAALPASADANGPISLLPNGGTATGATFNSLIGAGLTLDSALDPFLQKTEVRRTIDVDETVESTSNVQVVVEEAIDPLLNAYYIVSNPSGAAIKLTVSAPDGTYVNVEDGYYFFVSGNATTKDDSEGNGDIDLVGTPSSSNYSNEDFNCGANATPAECSSTNLGGLSTTLPYVDIDTAGAGSAVYVTNATRIAVRATANTTANSGAGVAGNRSLAKLSIDSALSSRTTAIALDVNVLADRIASGATQLMKFNLGDIQSKVERVNLLPAASVAVTTTMAASAAGVNIRNDNNLRATVALGSSVNPHAVYDKLRVAFYEDGTPMLLMVNAETASDVVSGNIEVVTPTISATTGVITANADKITLVGQQLTRTATNLSSAVYSARAIFQPTSPDIFVGPRSVVLDLRSGTNATVSDARAVFTEGDNVVVDTSNNAVIRSTTKSVTVDGQITRATAPVGDYAAAGVRVRATVVGLNVGATSEITVTGSTTKIVEDDDVITVFGFTNSNGRFPITINSTTGANLDQVSVTFQALLDTGLYSAGATETITWRNAALETELEISPTEYLTGETVNVTFTAVDQFGVGMDQTTVGRVSIRVDAYVDGAVKTATYSETKPTTNGAASFSFKNFATAGSNQEIQVTVFQASTAGTPVYYTVYNNVATSSIAVADAFSNRVQYVDYVVGKTTDAATLKAATDAGVIAEFTSGSAGTDFANIVGTALDANNAGQPGIPVTIAATGVLFHDAETSTIAKDTITVYSNGQGYFDVQALAQKANAAGATVTITAGGKTATTKLRTFLPTTIDAKNLKFSWALPAQMVKNTTYSVVATLTDVWGNPIQTLKKTGGSADANGVTFSADGSIQVNGVATVARNFNASGQATVFVRSVTDIAGPGQFSAVLSNTDYFTGGASSETGEVTTVANIYTDTTTTSWNEASWSDTLSVVVDVLDRATVTGKVNVGSFNGKLVVYAQDLAGARISWKVGGNWGTAIAQGNTLNRFDRPTPRRGVTVSVEIYVNGVKQLTKSVVTR